MLILNVIDEKNSGLHSVSLKILVYFVKYDEYLIWHFCSFTFKIYLYNIILFGILDFLIF